ncbi:TonB-dependent receptor [Sphingobium ummariense]|uniref:TonB-dependent receptor-like beta-barrel domain-containing protein n=1 Tax=Sphingobium ummariense RL-3 TaxID=1346791 RepID=T0K055_9SPHN|nr:TonB-dependent receptor [Sphingobium ummariense]EQB29894.1 hypothetical protein M529_22475 [Sphingobium ummariense RL-3]
MLKINPNGLGPTVFNTVIAPTLVPTLGPRAFYNDQYITGDFYSTYGDFNRSKSNLDVWGLGLTANWKVADWLSIKSITAYRTSKSDNDRDGDGSPLVILGPATLIDQKQFSQELQFSGETANRRFKWIAGLYYLRESIDFVAPVNISFVDTDNRAIIENRSYAAFGQASFSVTDRLRVTGGLRYTRDKKRNAPTIIATRLIDPATLTPVPPQALPIPFLISDESRTDSKVTPAATIDYKFSDDVFGYFTYSQGFKSGGFSQRIAFPRQKAPSFDPETVKSYEAGLKLELLDRRLRLNTAAFYTDYSNLQVIIFNNVEPQTQNGGAATLKGVEFEMQSRPVDGLSVNFSAGYLDAKYDSINPGTLIPANAKLAYTPEWTLSGSIAYEAQTSIGTITPRLDWSYRSAVRFDALNTPELVQPGYHLLNANLTYVDPSEKWRVALGVTNLTNRHYLVGGFSDLPATGFVDGTYARPREWYLTVRRNF